MQNNLLPIGRMAAMNHMTVAALRLYDRLGLLKPAHVDPDTGYRYYRPGQNARLDMISYMKELGMSLEEIGRVLEKEDVMLIEEVLIRKNEQLHRQMRALKARHEAVERAIAGIERYRKSPLTGTTSLEYIDRRRVWGIPCARNFYRTGLEDFERAQNELRQRLIDRGVRQVYSYNIGTSILQRDFERAHLTPDRVFVFADEHFALKEETALVDSGMYACLYLDAFEEEEGGIGALREYCRARRYRVTGDYLCEILTEFNVFDDSRRSMFLRLQVPVAF